MALKNSTIVLAILFATAVVVGAVLFSQSLTAPPVKYIPAKIPWNSAAEKVSYLADQLKQLRTQFPNGTDAKKLKTYLQKDGFSVRDCWSPPSGQSADVCFDKSYGGGLTVYYRGTCDENGKVVSIEYKGESLRR